MKHNQTPIKLGLGVILGWIFGALFLFWGVGKFTTSMYSGVSLVFIAFLMTPLFDSATQKSLRLVRLELSTPLKVVLKVVLFFVLSFVALLMY